MKNEQSPNQNNKALLICCHIKKLSKKQVTQILENPAQLKCQTHGIKSTEERLCLHCNKIWCGVEGKQKCISTHQTLTQGHIFWISVKKGIIFCSECNETIDSQLEQFKSKEQNEQLKKLKRFSQFIKQTFTKLQSFHESMKQIDNYITYRGLQNLGNTCFLNSDLQVLNYSQKLIELYQTYSFNGGFSKSISTIKKPLSKQIEYFYDDVIEEGQSKVWHLVVKKNHNKQEEINQKLIKTITNCKFNQLIKKLFEEMRKTETQHPFEPEEILEFFCHIDNKYSLQQEQDAQETLLFMIDILVQGQLTTMQYDIQRYNKVQKLIGRQKISPTQRLFGFYLVSQVFCQNCKKINYTFDLTYHLSIDIETKVNKQSCTIQQHLSTDIQMKEKVYHKALKYPQSLSQKPIVLPQFLHSFFQEQRLTQRENYYSCSSCKSLVGLKKFYLVDLPEIFIISVKRFNHKLVKNSRHVIFEEFIDVKDVALVAVNQDEESEKNITNYRIYAVIVHLGQTIHNGHYVCYVRTNENIWLRCSDHVVKKVTWKQVKDQQAYVLLYQKITQNQ